MIEPHVTQETFIIGLWIIFVGGGIAVCGYLIWEWMRKYSIWRHNQKAHIKKMFGDDTIKETINRL